MYKKLTLQIKHGINNKMEFIKTMQMREGVDVGYNNSNIHPENREGCVGVNGLDKSLLLHQVVDIAYKMENRPNVIVKAGKNAKWYLKRFPKDQIDVEIQKQTWRDTSRSVMYLIEWI
jgi:hypothetical protein